MPLPKPKPKENYDNFIRRCLSNPTMLDEYPDDKQRYAVCESQWDNKKEEGDVMNKKTKMEVPELKSDTQSDMERRFVTIDNSELRADTVGDRPMIVGYAARFNTWDGDESQFLEKIQRGAFSATIKRNDVRCLFNHDSNYLLGRKSAKTLRLWEDNIGLWMEVDVNQDDPQAMSVFSKITRRDVTGQSFSFYNPKDIWDFTDETTPRRTLTEVDLVDIGPVTFPFYEVTSAEPAYRSLTRARDALKPANDGKLVTPDPKLTRIQDKRRRDNMFKLLKED